MPASNRRPLFQGTVANGATQYVGIPVGLKGITTIHLAWKDATSAATVTLQHSLFSPDDAPVGSAGSAWHWVNSATSVTGPAATAAGASLTQLSGVGPNLRSRLRIVATANCDLEVYAETF